MGDNGNGAIAVSNGRHTEAIKRVPNESIHPAAVDIGLFFADCLGREDILHDGDVREIGWHWRQLLTVKNTRDLYKNGMRADLEKYGMQSDRLAYLDSLLAE